MNKIKIPFNEWSIERMRDGRKTATSRNKKYGRPGDIFHVGNMDFELESITQHSLHNVAYFHFDEEGANDPLDFMDVWIELHPKKGFVKDQKVYYHTFKRFN